MPISDKESPRAMAVIGFIALFLTVAGYVTLGVVLKMRGYPFDQTVRWSPLAVQLRQHGHWTLVVVVLWLIYAIACWQIDRGLFSEWLAGVVGTLLLGAIAVLYIAAISHPYTRPLLISVEPRAHRTPALSGRPTTPN